MTLLCFLLDLRSIPPPLLRELKQCLLQLANLYAVTSGRGEGEREVEGILLPLRDRIGLCYLHKGRSPSSSSEFKIAYQPGGDFNLHDFHHAVNNLPTDSFLPESSESMPVGSGDQDISLANLLSMEALYAWGGEYVQKKVITIGASVFSNSEALEKSLVDAAERCVTVEFVVFEQEEANLYHDVSEKLKGFINSISDLENCVLRRYLPDTWVLYGLVKRWLQELRNDIEEPVQAVFRFKNILGCTNHISCNLFASSNQIIDAFTPCQSCRCHGYPISNTINKKAKRFCPFTCIELGAFDLIENAVRVGEQTVLFLPSFDGLPKLQRISAPITFNVIERTNLASLNEGVIVGTSYVVTPSACHETEAASEECDKSELNIQLFHGLCGALFQLDQGLVCSSTCNTEIMNEGTFQCFYVLQPSDKGQMLLRRLAGSEEILPIPDMSRSNDAVIPEDIKNSIQAFLSKIEVRDYNPLQHERGLHPKLNWLVKESLKFGSIPPLAGTSHRLQNLTHHTDSILEQPLTTQVPEEEMYPEQSKVEDKTSSCVTEEWEQLLIIDEMNDSYSPISMSKPMFQNSPLTSKPLDEKTSRILERLEAPKQQKQKAGSPSVSCKSIGGQMKKPLLPFDSGSSQPLKPNFQKLKRKQR